jgi:hypothetical protein
MSRYFSQAELNRIAAEVDEELDRRAYEARDAQQIAQLERAMADPVLRKEIDSHPLVKSLRAMPPSPGWGPPHLGRAYDQHNPESSPPLSTETSASTRTT